MFVKVCRTSEISEGSLYRFDVGDKPLLVTKVADQYFVMDTFCTHQEADLSLGMFSDDVITCPLHHAHFSVKDGSVLEGPDGEDPSTINRLGSYKTKAEEGELWVDL